MVKETGVDKFANDIVCLISSGLVEDPDEIKQARS